MFGVHLGDNVDDSIYILQDYGYKKNEYPPDNAYKYVKGDINIILVYEGDTITQITVSLNANTADEVNLWMKQQKKNGIGLEKVYLL